MSLVSLGKAPTLGGRGPVTGNRGYWVSVKPISSENRSGLGWLHRLPVTGLTDPPLRPPGAGRRKTLLIFAESSPARLANPG